MGYGWFRTVLGGRLHDTILEWLHHRGRICTYRRPITSCSKLAVPTPLELKIGRETLVWGNRSRKGLRVASAQTGRASNRTPVSTCPHLFDPTSSLSHTCIHPAHQSVPQLHRPSAPAARRLPSIVREPWYRWIHSTVDPRGSRVQLAHAFLLSCGINGNTRPHNVESFSSGRAQHAANEYGSRSCRRCAVIRVYGSISAFVQRYRVYLRGVRYSGRHAKPSEPSAPLSSTQAKLCTTDHASCNRPCRRAYSVGRRALASGSRTPELGGTFGPHFTMSVLWTML